jgi:hypothetical protein
LWFDRIGFETTYHVAMNELVIEQCAAEIDSLTMPRFINWRSRESVQFGESTMFTFDPYDGSLGFSTDPTRFLWEGSTVTYAAMQLAFYMGFSEVILIGVDHSFSTQGRPHTTVVSEGDDPDHFDPRYFGRGFKWQLPDLESSELSYRLAEYHFRRKQRRIVDATIGGKLAVFPKVEYEALFQDKGQSE